MNPHAVSTAVRVETEAYDQADEVKTVADTHSSRVGHVTRRISETKPCAKA